MALKLTQYTGDHFEISINLDILFDRLQAKNGLKSELVDVDTLCDVLQEDLKFFATKRGPVDIKFVSPDGSKLFDIGKRNKPISSSSGD